MGCPWFGGSAISTVTELCTERLVLRRLCESDYDALYALYSDPETTRHAGGTWSRERTRAALARIIENYGRSEIGWNAVTERATGAFIGVCWLAPLDRAVCEALQCGPRVEIGNVIAAPYWNRGYATEAGTAMLRHGFLELGLKEIVAVANPRSIASDRVLEKLGMTYRKTFLLEAFPLNFYTLTQDEYLHAMR